MLNKKIPVSSTPEYSKFIEHIDDVVEIRLRCMVKIENFTHYYFKKKRERNLNSKIANVLWHNSKIFIHSHVDKRKGPEQSTVPKYHWDFV